MQGRLWREGATSRYVETMPSTTLAAESTTIQRRRVLGADARPVRPLPRWTLYASAPLVALSIAAKLVHASVVQSLANAALVVALVASVFFFAWLEERCFDALRRSRIATRLAIGALMPLVGAVAIVGASGVVGAALSSIGGAMWAPVLVTGGLWFAGAAIGSFVILLIDLVVSALVRSFLARVTAAILCLIGVAFGIALGTTILVVALEDSVRSSTLLNALRVDGDPATRAQIATLFDNFAHHPLLVASAVYGIAMLVALPAVISASRQLAEAVMDRIHPLSAAFDAVARGERDVALEEAGSADFVQVSQRFNRMVDALTLGERMERAFGSYVSGRLLDRIRAQHGEAQIPASLRDASVFFADIRGFTSMSERLAPDAMVALLNRYFERVVARVDEHEGYLNKFIGDAVVVVFNGPVEQPTHAEMATRCAVALQQLVAKMNAEGAFPEVDALNIGVGVSSGPMVCGNVGSIKQMEYTVIGDTVNLAARLTSHAGAGEVWISERTAKALPETIAREPLAPIGVKGKAAPVTPYRAWPMG